MTKKTRPICNPHLKQDLDSIMVAVFLIGFGIMIGFVIGCIFELNNIGTYTQCVSTQLCR